MTEVLAAVLIGAGLLFYLSGSIGLLRLPDLFTRLHALTKADNLGLGFLVSGMLLLSDGPLSGLKLILIWLLVMAASAVGAQLIARHARRNGDG
jgi:multicomponent Na+:H+ antiporter subunit G